MSRTCPWKLNMINSRIENWRETFVTVQTSRNIGLILLAVERGVKTGVIMRVVLIWNWVGIDWITELH